MPKARAKDKNGRFVLNDLTGQRFGKLLVVSLQPRCPSGKTKWLCRCDCGKDKIVCSAHLLDGNQQSCGCNRTNPLAGFIQILAHYRCSARKAGRVFALDDASFMFLTSSPCYYCGLPPSKVRKSFCGAYTWNGIDRVDSTHGYELWNCVPCCHTCNIAKRAMTTSEFYAWIDRVSGYRAGQVRPINAIGEILAQCA
jgi:hypothetical protein